MKKYYRLVFIVYLSLPLIGYADQFSPQATYTVCFTPRGDCTDKIIDVIDNAKSAIFVQAYSFTSKPITRALAAAQKRGVQVKVIMDKSAYTQYQPTANYLARNNIPIWIDKKPNIAHNKVMVIDEARVITGSFNFTHAAQYNNAENVLIITDVGLAQKYWQNWLNRQHVSIAYTANAEVGTSTLPDWLEQLFDLLWKWLGLNKHHYR